MMVELIDLGAVFDLPVPPSVNKVRKLDRGGIARVRKWHEKADALLMCMRYRPCRYKRFELHITVSEMHCKADLDNNLKALVDYLKRIEAIVDDAPNNMRKIVVEWGEAPEGVRVNVRPI